MIRACLILLAVFSNLCFADDDAPPRFRLDDRAVPLAYAWRVAIDPAQPRFEGEVRITMKLSRATPVLWLNATRLDIDAVEFRQGERVFIARTLPGGEDFVGLAAEGEPFAAGE